MQLEKFRMRPQISDLVGPLVTSALTGAKYLRLIGFSLSEVTCKGLASLVQLGNKRKVQN